MERLKTNRTGYYMKKGKCVSIPSRGNAITCTGGLIWLTGKNSIEDHMLRKGDSLELSGMKAVVLEALTDSSLNIERIPLFRPTIHFRGLAAVNRRNTAH